MMLKMQFILLSTMLRCKSCLKTIETNKAESKDANEDTCNVCAYDFLTLQDLLTHNHSHDNINNHNDDKTVDVENKVESDNAPENNVGEVF